MYQTLTGSPRYVVRGVITSATPYLRPQLIALHTSRIIDIRKSIWFTDLGISAEL